MDTYLGRLRRLRLRCDLSLSSRDEWDEDMMRIYAMGGGSSVDVGCQR